MAQTTITIGPVMPPDALDAEVNLHPLWPPREFLDDAVCPFCGHPLVPGTICQTSRGLAHADCVSD